MAVSVRHKVISDLKGYTELQNLETGEHILWDGTNWIHGYIVKVVKPCYRIHFWDDDPLDVTSNQSFLTVGGVWQDTAKVRNKSIVITSPLTNLKIELDYEHNKLKRLDDYDLGVFYSRLRNKETEAEATILRFKEKEFDLTKEVSDILSKVCEFDRYTEFSTQGNETVFLIFDQYIQNLSNFPEEVYLSSEFMRGFLRGVFDNAQVTAKGLRLFQCKMDFMLKIKEMLKLFGILSFIDRNSLYIKLTNTGAFMLTIGTISDTVGLNIHKIWNGYQSWANARSLRVRYVEELEEIEMAEIYTESAVFCLNGFVLGCSD